MPTLESTIRMINRRLNEVYNFFGVKTPEYQNLQKILYQNFNSEHIVKGGGKRAARISRSKAAMEAFKGNSDLMEDINWIYEAVKKMGTVKEMAERYVEPSEYKGSLFTNREAERLKSTIQERAHAEYAASYNDADIYAEVDKEIEKGNFNGDRAYQEALTDIMDKFHEEPGKNNLPGMERKYSEIVEMYEEAVERHEEWKKAVDYSGDILKTSNPYDMGINQ